MLLPNARWLLSLATMYLGVCIVLYLNYDEVRQQLGLPYGDLRLSKMSYNTDKNKKIENILHECSKNSSQYQIFHKRLQLLQKYIPKNYSTNFKNPCWYDFHQAPSSEKMDLMKKETRKTFVGKCAIPLSYTPSLAKDVVEQAKTLISKGHLYCLPSFFLSGFPKCASTTLYAMMIQHPKITEPKCKENHFWAQFVNQQGTDLDKRMQILQYLDYFSPSIRTIQSKQGKITLDASVGYHTWNSESDYCVLPNLLMRVLPEAKFILIMRNPSERVFSHYFYYLRRHYVTMANYFKYISSKLALEVFHNCISVVVLKFQSCIDSGHSTSSCVRNKTIDERDTDRNGHVGLQTSMYYYHIVPWLNIFPRERFLFLRTEDLARNQSLTMSKVWHFLHLDDFPVPKEIFAKANNHSELPERTREVLDAFFQPHNELLANLLSDSKFLWKD